jgi:hypothetical protein
MSDPPSVMSGHIRRQGSGLVGVLNDPFGFITHLTGVLDPAVPGRWILTATVVVPEGLKVAFLDDEVPP